MILPFARKRERWSYCPELLFDDGVVAIGEQLLFDGSRLHTVGEGANLDMQKLVLRLVSDDYTVAALAQSRDQNVCIFATGDGGDLDHRLACRGVSG